MESFRVARLAAGLVVAVAGVAAGQSLNYRDEEHLKRFDHQYRGAKADLDAADEERLRNDTFARSIEQKLGYMVDALGGVSQPGHAEVTKRRADMNALKAGFEQRRARALEGLGQADRKTLEDVAKACAAIEAKLLAADGKKTILRGDPRQPDTEFDQEFAALGKRLDGVRNQGHADLAAARQRLQDTVDAVSVAKDACVAKLATFGDVGTGAKAHSDWIIGRSHPSPENDRLLPWPPEKGSVEDFAAYARTLREAMAEVKRRADHLAGLEAWDPRWQQHGDIELKNRVRRALGLAADALKGARGRVRTSGYHYNIVGDPLALTLEKLDALDVRALRAAVVGVDHYRQPLEETVGRLERAAAFREAFDGKPCPEVARSLADLQAKLAHYDARVGKQLDAERLPAPGPGHAKHVATARRLLPTALGVVIDGDVEHYEGVETSKQELGRRSVGNGLEEVRYRVHKYPYDYEYLAAYAVFEEKGVCKVYLVDLKYHNKKYGDAPLGQWFVDGKYLQHGIRKENVRVPEVEAVAAPAPAPAPTAVPAPDPAPTAPPADRDVPEPTPPSPEPAREVATDEPPARAGVGLFEVIAVLACGGFCVLVVVGAGGAAYLAKAKAAAGGPPAPPG